MRRTNPIGAPLTLGRVKLERGSGRRLMTRTAVSARFCDLVGIEHPIILAPMGGGPGTPELVAAVANAGGLGSMAAGYLSQDELATTIDQTRGLTRGSSAINIFVPSSRPLSYEPCSFQHPQKSG